MSEYKVGDVVKGTIVKREEGLIKLRVGEGLVAESHGDQTSGEFSHCGQINAGCM